MTQGGEAQARSEEMVTRLREKFELDQVEAEFVVLVGRSGGLCLVGQVGAWLQAQGLAASERTVFRWINSLRVKLDSAFEIFSLQGAGPWLRVYQFTGKKLYRELGMENSRWRYPVEKDGMIKDGMMLVEIKRRLVSVGAVLSLWWYPWLGTAEASVAWCDALGIDRAVLPQTRYGKDGKKKPSYFADRSPHAADSNRCVFVCPVVVEGKDESRGLRKWGRDYARLWQALGRAGVQTTVVVARSAETLSVPVADVTSGWEASRDSHLAVRGIWFDTQHDYVLAGNPPAALEALGGPEGIARRRRELAAAIEEARAEVGPGVAKIEELVLEEVPT